MKKCITNDDDVGREICDGEEWKGKEGSGRIPHRTMTH